MSAVAREFRVTRVRVWQMLNLLNLDKRIIEYLTDLTDPKEINYWTERKLRKLVKIPADHQFKRFQKIIESRRNMGELL